MRKYVLFMGVLSLITACSSMPSDKMNPQKNIENKKQTMDHKSSFFVARKGVEDGYVFIFHIMPAPEGEKFSRINHHLMVSIEKNGQPITDLKLFSDVKHPNGDYQAKTLMMKMGVWYMMNYKLNHEQGRHWMTVSFEESGKTYVSGVYYPKYTYK